MHSSKLSFEIYTFQFRPILPCVNGSLFEDLSAERKAIMQNKNSRFRELPFNVTYLKNQEILRLQPLFEEDDIIAFKLANKRKMDVEMNFEIKTFEAHPSVIVIINNDPDIQRIAIQIKKDAFTTPDVVASILRKAYNKALKRYELEIKINKEYVPSEFWEEVSNYKDSIQKVRFNFDYPNLPSVHKYLTDELKALSERSGSTQTSLELNAVNPESCLSLNEDDIELKNLVKASSIAGNPIALKVKGLRSYIKTGKTDVVLQLDELEIQGNNASEISKAFKSIITENDE